MNGKPSKNGFLKGLFGFKRAGTESHQANPLPEPPAVDVHLAVTSDNPPSARTNAYLNRKKGRKTHRDSLEDLERIVALIGAKGEITPGEMEQELGMSRSTLTYNLKRLKDYIPGVYRRKKYIGHVYHYFFPQLLEGRRLERLGAGRNVRYRLVADTPKP